MAGIAQIAQSQGHIVRGCDQNVYPPMSDVLAAAKIKVDAGFDPINLPSDTDCVIIGNALSRGNPMVEYILDQRVAYQSGPQWLSQNVLQNKRVIAVAGTHGKTSTSSMISWILEKEGKSPGFLIGGKPGNFTQSARLGDAPWFIIEADEYDTAFFDKRSKFVHYQPFIAVLNNLEFDHADIFDDIGQIKTQFHHLIRIVPASGSIVWNQSEQNLADVIDMGCWSNATTFNSPQWNTNPTLPDCSEFEVLHNSNISGRVTWQCIGQHNMHNALAAIVAANIAGVPVENACENLASFVPSARRMQRLYQDHSICLYEDFAHHPTAIRTSIEAVSQAHPNKKVVALLEPRSNTMKSIHHKSLLGNALSQADHQIFYIPATIEWHPNELTELDSFESFDSVAEVVDAVLRQCQESCVILAMSNGGFDHIPALIAERLNS